MIDSGRLYEALQIWGTNVLQTDQRKIRRIDLFIEMRLF